MNTELDRDRVAELLPLYALDLLDPAEMQAVAAYLQQHPEWQDRQADLEEVVLQLARSAPAAPLPAAARDRLLGRVQADLDAAPEPVAWSAPAPVRRPARSARFAWLAAAASLVLALGLFGFLLRQQDRIGDLGAEVQRLTGEVTELRQQNQLLEEQRRASQNQLALYLAAERAVALAGTDLAPGAQGAFYLSEDEGVVVVSGLQPLPADLTYQLWLVPPDGVPTSVALLPIGSDGLFTQTVSVPSSLSNFAIVDVSIEQAGGSPAINKETIVLRGVITDPS